MVINNATIINEVIIKNVYRWNTSSKSIVVIGVPRFIRFLIFANYM